MEPTIMYSVKGLKQTRERCKTDATPASFLSRSTQPFAPFESCGYRTWSILPHHVFFCNFTRFFIYFYIQLASIFNPAWQ